METITRKSLLNKSALGFMCINHAQGCSHGCLYPCYAFSMARSYGRAKDYSDWLKPRLVANAVELLTKELDRLKEKPPYIHFSLTTDPFMTGFPEMSDMSLELIALVNERGIPCSVLTKGSLPPELADRRRFPAENIFGISLVSMSEEFRGRWEPGATSYAERVGALKALHERGCRVQVHMEPYPTPNIVAQDLKGILDAIGFVDSIFFGGWNYSRLVREFPGYRDFYGGQAHLLRRFCEERGIDCEIASSIAM